MDCAPSTRLFLYLVIGGALAELITTTTVTRVVTRPGKGEVDQRLLTSAEFRCRLMEAHPVG